jgi:2-succinyl-5-enolpyruvyl-6-hydroxy-3-cyclohexene-1-carboxylate synthase
VSTPDHLIPPALSYAQALLAQLIGQGVREIVLCPGSRSAPLAYAAVAAERAGLVRLHVLVDERSAGFLALGMGKGSAGTGDSGAGEGLTSGVPAAVITTSGTAVANLHPAVLEAHHSDIPLIVLSADRPHELRGTGANQTTTQVGIFADALRLAVEVGVPFGAPSEAGDARAIAARAYAASTGIIGRPGPVHLNVGFREPLAPSPEQLVAITERFAEPVTPVYVSGDSEPPVLALGAERPVETAARTVIVAGDRALSQAGAVAVAQGWPIIAEPSSGLVAHPNAFPGAVNILAHQEGDTTLAESVEQVLVFGHPTLTRPVQRLIGRTDVRTIVFPTHGDQWIDAPRTADAVLYGVPDYLLVPSGNGSDQWLIRWREHHAALDQRLTTVLDTNTELTGPVAPMRAVRALAASAQAGDTLVFGASSAIRDADSYVTAWPTGVRILSNRGLAGIDGTISMARGVAFTHLGRTRLMLGDLTFLHDIGGLLRGPREPVADLDIIVLNDCGGAIFGGLEHGVAGDTELYERVFGTSHVSDLAQLCAGYRVDHTAVRTVAELEEFLSGPRHGIRVAELNYPRAQRAETHAELVKGMF